MEECRALAYYEHTRDDTSVTDVLDASRPFGRVQSLYPFADRSAASHHPEDMSKTRKYESGQRETCGHDLIVEVSISCCDPPTNRHEASTDQTRPQPPNKIIGSPRTTGT